jgi:hypothetical protein
MGRLKSQNFVPIYPELTDQQLVKSDMLFVDDLSG